MAQTNRLLLALFLSPGTRTLRSGAALDAGHFMPRAIWPTQY